MKYISSLIILATGFSSAHAVLNLNIESYTSTELTFNITGTMGSTTPPGSMSQLVIESPTNANWITGTAQSSGAVATGPTTGGFDITGSPITGVTLSDIRFFNGHSDIADAFQFFFDSNLSTSSTGNGTSVTVTLPAGHSYNTDYDGDLGLSWGQKPSDRAEIWGVAQSTSPVPEPSSSATIAGVLALAFVARRRR
ncbi:MAG: PEP-CTERM sorting domain-containing protein [Opitutaceae bacterium]